MHFFWHARLWYLARFAPLTGLGFCCAQIEIDMLSHLPTPSVRIGMEIENLQGSCWSQTCCIVQTSRQDLLACRAHLCRPSKSFVPSQLPPSQGVVQRGARPTMLSSHLFNIGTNYLQSRVDKVLGVQCTANVGTYLGNQVGM